MHQTNFAATTLALLILTITAGDQPAGKSRKKPPNRWYIRQRSHDLG